MRAHLTCTLNGRRAEYVLELKAIGGGYVVSYGYGKIGTVLRAGTNKDTKNPVEWAKAAKAYNRTLTEKVSEGYIGEGTGAFAGAEPGSVLSNGAGEATETETVETPVATQRPMTYGIGEHEQCELLTEISESEALRFIKNPDYLAQTKEDGDRRGIMKGANGVIFGINRKGQPSPLPQEIAEAYATLDAKTFKLDGEILDNPDYSVVWDILELNGEDLRQKPYFERLAILEELVGERPMIGLVSTWEGELAKTMAVVRLNEVGAEGVVFKKRSASWIPGRAGQHLKLKFWKTCTVRICKKTAKAHLDHNSAAIELFDEKRQRWVPVGHFNLNGKKAVEIGELWEVRYLYFWKNSLYGPVEVLRKRDDLDDDAAVLSQVKVRQERKDIVA